MRSARLLLELVERKGSTSHKIRPHPLVKTEDHSQHPTPAPSVEHITEGSQDALVWYWDWEHIGQIPIQVKSPPGSILGEDGLNLPKFASLDSGGPRRKLFFEQPEARHLMEGGSIHI